MNKFTILADRTATLVLDTLQSDNLTPLTISIESISLGSGPLAWIDWKKPSGEKVYTGSYAYAEEIETTITDAVLDESGILTAQLRVQDDTGFIWHSEPVTVQIISSINATDPATSDDRQFVEVPATFIDGNITSYNSASGRLIDIGESIADVIATVQSEASRVIAEGGRVDEEALRVLAEASRVSVEENRVSAEELRVIAEASRVLAELGRGTAEDARVLSEAARAIWESYNGATDYVIGNKVYYLGSSYICIAESTGNLPTNPTYWQIIVAKGETVENATEVNISDAGNYYTGTEVETALQEVGAEQIVQNEQLADYANKFYDNAGAHNSIYRGKYLGNTETSAQQTAISSGTFEDLYIGDYWTIGGINYRIAGFNYFRNVGDTALTANHVTIVPDTVLYNAQMNATNVTTGGYVNSEMRTTNLASAITTIETAFPGVVNHRQILTNATTNSKASGWSWYDSKVELMNEVMVYGSVAWGEATYNSGYNVGSSHGRLPLFALRQDMVNIRQTYWLRDVVSAAFFARASHDGDANYNDASGARGVRPAFSIS